MTREESTIHRDAILAFLHDREIEMRPPGGDNWTRTSEPGWLPDWEYREVQTYVEVNVEALITACVPAGSVCDPQAIADNIRFYCEGKGGV